MNYNFWRQFTDEYLENPVETLPFVEDHEDYTECIYKEKDEENPESDDGWPTVRAKYLY